MSLNEKPCRNCAVLKAQLEQQEAIVAKYLKIVQSQSELIQDLQNKSSTVGTSPKSSPRKQYLPTTYNGWDTTSNDSNNKKTRVGYRAFIGSITSGIDKESLKKCLEDSFGKVDSIDIISSKACAFADFASPTAYHNAVSEGALIVNGIALSVERVRRPKPRK